MISSPTAPNPNKLMAQLRMMPDQQLVQYAQMHKNDPYIFPMAFQESNTRKQMRAAAQNPQAAQAPKVVDQNLQEMAQPMPEDQGIATLPAPNMQNMAGGGIVAFDDGGEVRHFDGSRGSFVGTSSAVPPGAIIIGNMYQDPETGEMKPLPGVEFKPLTQEQRNLGNAKLIPSLSDIADFFRNPYNKRRAAIERGNEAGAEQNKALIERYKPRRSDDQQFESDVAQRNKLPDPTATSVNTPGAGTAPPVPPAPSDKRRLPSGPKLVEPAIPQQSGLAALNTKPMSAEDAMAAAGKFGDDAKMRKELQSYVDRQKKIGEDAVGSFEKGIAGLPEAYKKYEARLQKEEAEAATDKDKAVGMSIFKAGLAMMSGTSQNAFENIGKGAMVGLEDQQAALKEFKKAQRERNKAFADIEQARLADQRGDLKTKLELESRAADRTSNAEGRMVEGIAKLFDTNKTNARGIYQTGVEQTNQNQRTMYTTAADITKQSQADAAALERVKIQANTPTGLERIYSNPALFSKHMEATTAATGMRGDAAYRETWAKSPYLQTQYPKIEDYLRAMGVQPTVNLPANATNVRP